jgi:hypothetical protein
MGQIILITPSDGPNTSEWTILELNGLENVHYSDGPTIIPTSLHTENKMRSSEEVRSFYVGSVLQSFI